MVVDVFDGPALTRAMMAAGPEIVIHQLTDLALIHDRSRLEEALARNARLRTEGTRILVAAGRDAGAHRLLAQSIAWVYAAGAGVAASREFLRSVCPGTADLVLPDVDERLRLLA